MRTTLVRPLFSALLMQLVLIVAVLAALMSSECGPSQPVSWPGIRLMLAVAAMAMVVLFAWGLSRHTARQVAAEIVDADALRRRFRRLQGVHTVLWLGAAGVVLYGLDWPRLVRFNGGLDGVFLADDLLILVPVLAPLILSWAAFYEVERAVYQRLAALIPPAPQEPLPGRGKHLALQVRHGLGILLVPVLAIMAVQDAVRLLTPDLVRDGRGALVFLPAVGAICLLFPALLRYVLPTRPLPAGPLRCRLEEIARRSGFRTREILVWQTGGTIVNAAVAGFVRPLRYVFLTDALLQRLDENEIEAVFGHEAGHVRHHHLVLRVLTIIVPLSVWTLAGQLFPDVAASLRQWSDAVQIGWQAPVSLVMLAVMAAYMFVVFGYYSRQLEHQADLFGCRQVQPGLRGQSVAIFSSALEKLGAGNRVGRKTGSWQHASIARRVEFLHELSLDPRRELHFHRRVRLLDGLVIGIVLSPLVHQLLLG